MDASSSLPLYNFYLILVPYTYFLILNLVEDNFANLAISVNGPMILIKINNVFKFNFFRTKLAPKLYYKTKD